MYLQFFHKAKQIKILVVVFFSLFLFIPFVCMISFYSCSRYLICFGFIISFFRFTCFNIYFIKLSGKMGAARV